MGTPHGYCIASLANRRMRMGYSSLFTQRSLAKIELYCSSSVCAALGLGFDSVADVGATGEW